MFTDRRAREIPRLCGGPSDRVLWRGRRRRAISGARDRYIGWSAEARRRHLRFLAYNPRYLILPWIHVPHLASHLLGEMAAVLRRLGTSLRASDLLSGNLRRSRAVSRHLLPGGELGGDGTDDRAGQELSNKRPNRSIKEVLGYPLTPHFRQLLAAEVARWWCRRTGGVST